MKKFLWKAKMYRCQLHVILVAIFLLSTWCGNCLALGLEWLPGKGAPNWFSASEDNEKDILVFLHADKLMNGESIVWDDCFNARVTFEGLSNICARIGQKTQLENLRFFYLSPTKLANLDMSFLSCVTNLHLLQVVAKAKLENFSAIEVGQLRSLDLSAVIGIDDERCVGDMKLLETFSAPLVFSSLDILPSSVTNLCFKLSEANVNKSFEHLSNLKGLDVWAPTGRIDLQSRCAQMISKHTKLEALMLRGDWTGVDSLEFLSQMPLKLTPVFPLSSVHVKKSVKNSIP